MTNHVGRKSRNSVSALCAMAAMLCAAPSFAEPPGASGIVLRGEGLWGGGLIDSDAGLTLTWGFDTVAFCTDGTLEQDSLDGQIVDLPTAERSNLHYNGQARVDVWPFATADGSLDCEQILTTPKLASGLGLVKFMLRLTATSPPNASGFGFTVKGTIYDEVGNAIDVKAVSQNVFVEGFDARAIDQIILRYR